MNPYTLGGDAFYFGMADVNSQPSNIPDAQHLLFALLDDLVIEDLSLNAGDANDDGVVNRDDFALIDRGHALGLTGFANGDFNGDRIIDAADYLLIDKAFTGRLGPRQAAEFLQERRQRFGDEYALQLAAALPEPGNAGIIIATALQAALARRKHSVTS